MSDSHKARHGTSCKHWKDSVLASRSQKRAWSKTKRLRARRERARTKLENDVTREMAEIAVAHKLDNESSKR